MLNFTVPHLLHWRREGSGCAAGGVGLARSHRGMVATQKESARALYELELELELELTVRGHCHPLLQGGVHRYGKSPTTENDWHHAHAGRIEPTVVSLVFLIDTLLCAIELAALLQDRGRRHHCRRFLGSVAQLTRVGKRPCRSSIPLGRQNLIGMRAFLVIGIDRIARSACGVLGDRHGAFSVIDLGWNTQQRCRGRSGRRGSWRKPGSVASRSSLAVLRGRLGLPAGRRCSALPCGAMGNSPASSFRHDLIVLGPPRDPPLPGWPA
jgi:hypothetical protein